MTIGQDIGKALKTLAVGVFFGGILLGGVIVAVLFWLR